MYGWQIVSIRYEGSEPTPYTLIRRYWSWKRFRFVYDCIDYHFGETVYSLDEVKLRIRQILDSVQTVLNMTRQYDEH